MWATNQWLDLDPQVTHRYCPPPLGNDRRAASLSSYLSEMQLTLRSSGKMHTELQGSELLSAWAASVPAWNLTLGQGIVMHVHLQSIAQQWFDRWQGQGGTRVVTVPLVGNICVELQGVEQVYLRHHPWSTQWYSACYLLGVVCWTHAATLGYSAVMQMVVGGVLSVAGGLLALMCCVYRSWSWKTLVLWMMMGSCWSFLLSTAWRVVRHQVAEYYPAVGAVVSCVFLAGMFGVHTARRQPSLRMLLNGGCTCGWTLLSLILLLNSAPTLVRGALVTGATLVGYVGILYVVNS